MTTIYINPNSNSSGTGSKENPLNSLEYLALSPGDTVLAKSGTTIYGIIPSNIFKPGKITFGTYGSGDKFVIDGSMQITRWNYNYSYDLYYFTFQKNSFGNITENGKPMKFYPWDDDLNQLRSKMEKGSFTYNHKTYTVYINPYSKPISSSIFKASKEIDLVSVTGESSTISDISIQHASRHGVLISEAPNSRLFNIEIFLAGGHRNLNKSIYVGNGIEISRTTNATTVDSAIATDIFDSAFTTQLYGPNATLSDHTWNSITAKRCGMSALEISAWGQNKHITNIKINELNFEDIGKNCWSGNRGGSAIWVATSDESTSQISNIQVEKISGTDAIQAIRLDNNAGELSINQLYVEKCESISKVISKNPRSIVKFQKSN